MELKARLGVREIVMLVLAGTVAALWLLAGTAAAAPLRPSVSAGGESHTCGVRSDGTVACWGSAAWGQTTPPAGTFTQVSAGYFHTCGVRSDGTVTCWGYDGFGQATSPAGTFIQVSAGQYHTCGVRTDGSVACWGYNGSGEAAPPAGTFTQVSAGVGSHTCGVRSGGTVACWGFNGHGEATPPPGAFTEVSAGYFHTCGVRSGGTVACWGDNSENQATPPPGTFTQVDAGNFHTCGLRPDGTVACWGRGQAAAPPPAGTFTLLSAGGAHTCGVRPDGTVACWGENGHGQANPFPISFPPAGAGVGSPYSHQFAITDETPAPTFTLTAGNLPAGLRLSGSGLLSGTPTAAGAFSGTVCAGNNLAPLACERFTVTVAKASPTISTQASPGNLVGAPVRDVATLAGGFSPTGTVTFRLFSDAACTMQVFSSTKPLAGPTAASDWFTPAAAGTYHWTAVYNGDANNNAATSSCGASGESVTMAPFLGPAPTATLSGDVAGPLTVNAGQSVVITGARVGGPITVNRGGALTVVDSQIGGAITADDPAFLSLCGAQVSGPAPAVALSVTNATVPIRLGDPAAGCAGNRFAGQVKVADNLAVTFGANIVSHNATLDTNGPGRTVIKANTVLGALGCSGNTPAPTNAGQPNTAGSKTGQCGAL